MAPPVYGFDIETDTATGGLDPRTSAILAVAVATEHEERVFAGPEQRVLEVVDEHLRRLPPGVLVTWNGATFDLPFVADRAGRAAVRLGLDLVPDPSIPLRRAPLPGHTSAYRATWHDHVHLDAYQVYRWAAQRLGVSGSLKSIARLVGFEPVEVDRSRVHALPTRDLCLYCASDARLARILALRRWDQVCDHADVPLPRAG